MMRLLTNRPVFWWLAAAVFRLTRHRYTLGRTWTTHGPRLFLERPYQ